MIVCALGACHPDCPWCAREFFRWYKGRVNQMSLPLPRVQDYANGDYEPSSFALAAATSIRAGSPGEAAHRG